MTESAIKNLDITVAIRTDNGEALEWLRSQTEVEHITSCTSCNNAIFVGWASPTIDPNAYFCVGGQCPPSPIKVKHKNDIFLRVLCVFVVQKYFLTAKARRTRRLNIEKWRKLGTPIGLYDLQIAAICLQNNLILVTHNTNEFSRVEDLQIEDWESEE